ncbi:hypothetical protein NDU88_003825 [Pleurodeles waltl]|uniref:Uncharacterized protein n=1 Tax=Pleurodeles waltl TaxID=8319 RepID=A0AAV7KWL8_PLEWA|nr:hypothetical protein NDU88_003825 [Pleurodeles waltl]
MKHMRTALITAIFCRKLISRIKIQRVSWLRCSGSVQQQQQPELCVQRREARAPWTGGTPHRGSAAPGIGSVRHRGPGAPRTGDRQGLASWIGGTLPGDRESPALEDLSAEDWGSGVTCTRDREHLAPGDLHREHPGEPPRPSRDLERPPAPGMLFKALLKQNRRGRRQGANPSIQSRQIQAERGMGCRLSFRPTKYGEDPATVGLPEVGVVIVFLRYSPLRGRALPPAIGGVPRLQWKHSGADGRAFFRGRVVGVQG